MYAYLNIWIIDARPLSFPLGMCITAFVQTHKCRYVYFGLKKNKKLLIGVHMYVHNHFNGRVYFIRLEFVNTIGSTDCNTKLVLR